MSALKLCNLELVLFLRFLEFHVVMLIEILILFDMCLLDLLLSLLMGEHELLVLHVELLLLQLLNSILCHFSL